MSPEVAMVQSPVPVIPCAQVDVNVVSMVVCVPVGKIEAMTWVPVREAACDRSGN